MGDVIVLPRRPLRQAQSQTERPTVGEAAADAIVRLAEMEASAALTGYAMQLERLVTDMLAAADNLDARGARNAKGRMLLVIEAAETRARSRLKP